MTRLSFTMGPFTSGFGCIERNILMYCSARSLADLIGVDYYSDSIDYKITRNTKFNEAAES